MNVDDPQHLSRLLWPNSRYGRHEDLGVRVYAEQIALLYKQGLLAYSVTIANGAILVFVQKNHIEAPVLLAWFGVLLFVTGFRITLVTRYMKSVLQAQQAAYWHRYYLIGVALSGLVWGATAMLLFPPNSVEHQVFVAFVLAGMSAGGVAVLSARIEVCLLFLVLVLAPLAIQFFRLSSELHAAMGLMTVIFFLGMALTARTMHRAISTALSLRFDNRDLQHEIEQRRSAEESLYQEKERLQITLAAIDDGVVLTDPATFILYLNPAAQRLCKRNVEEVLQQPIADIFEVVNEQADQPSPISAAAACLQTGAQAVQSGLFRTNQGDKRYVEVLATPLHGRYGGSVGAVFLLRDITDRHRQTTQLIHEAQHDSLTGLPNRNLLKDRLNQAVLRARRPQQKCAVLFIDLDWFKEINDKFGHAMGDAVLKQTAARLLACVRAEDTVARLGGDEFVVIIERLADAEATAAIADKILQSLAEPFAVAGQEASVSASVGISVFPDHAMDAETLLRMADQAMYRAKERGRNQACIFKS